VVGWTNTYKTAHLERMVIREAYALHREPIHVWRVRERAVVVRQVIPTHVVAHDVNDVRRNRLLGSAGAGRQRDECEQADEGAAAPCHI
jgi:hypothetical protein